MFPELGQVQTQCRSNPEGNGVVSDPPPSASSWKKPALSLEERIERNGPYACCSEHHEAYWRWLLTPHPPSPNFWVFQVDIAVISALYGTHAPLTQGKLPGTPKLQDTDRAGTEEESQGSGAVWSPPTHR